MKKIIICFAILLISAKSAFALQEKEVFDGAEIRVTISKNNLSRIKLRGDKIVSVQANLGDINIKSSKQTGDIYVRPISNYNKVINLFLISEKGYTYKILTVPKNIPSEQIILHNPEIISEVDSKILKDDFKQTLINLHKSMIMSSPIEGYQISSLNKRVKLFVSSLHKKSKLHKKTKLWLKQTYSSALYKGEVYEVKNKSGEDLVLKEQDFFEPGVISIKIDSNWLGKGESTKVYIIRG